MSISGDSLPPNGPKLAKAFEALVTTLNERGVQYAIIGGLAVAQYGRVRSTEDVDVLIAVPALELPGMFEALRTHGFEIDLHKNIQELNTDGTTANSLWGSIG